MASKFLHCFPLLFVLLCAASAQQAYEAKLNLNCTNTDSIVYGYECNGKQKACQAYAVYRSQAGYQSLANISLLLNSNLSQMTSVNKIPEDEILRLDQPVIAPLTCSCAGNYSQANATYTIESGDTLFVAANNTLQALTTCQALALQNKVNETVLQIGMKITAPLRCACPTDAQASNGTQFLLSYTVLPGDTMPAIADQYGATEEEIRASNMLADGDTIFPSTTLLIPLRAAPTSAPSLSPPPPPPTSPSQGGGGGDRGGSKTVLRAGVSAAAAIVAAALIVGGWIFLRRRKKSQKPVNASDLIPRSPVKGNNDDLLAGISGNVLPRYKFSDLYAATGGFCAANRITASVYRGVLDSGEAVAVKIFGGDASQELHILTKLNHVNLVRLMGLSTGEGRLYFVFEYAENGSLDNLLHSGPGFESRSQSGSAAVLSWEQRLQIALDVAKGLQYLHNYASPGYVHKDIKSSNILLDGDFRAKIANFGLAKPTEHGAEDGGYAALTRHVVGTKGYMAPEYLSHGLVTAKLDVFSFGVVVLELLAGRAATSESGEAVLWREIGDVVEGSSPKTQIRRFMDPSLGASYSVDVALAVAELAKACVDTDLDRRPTTDQIVIVLSRWISTSAEKVSASEVLGR